jgi:hypothetical protein
MAQLWNYPSRRMRRDYVLTCHGREVLHIEAKHSWSRRQVNIETFLHAINRGDWASTRQDGVQKDLALLLWGAKERAARRAALIDEERLMVFDWDGRWTLRSEVKLFEDPTDDVEAAFGLLAPKAFGSGAQMNSHSSLETLEFQPLKPDRRRDFETPFGPKDGYRGRWCVWPVPRYYIGGETRPYVLVSSATSQQIDNG